MFPSPAVTSTYVDAPNKLVRGANGIDYAYRELGAGAVPLVLLQHFRGNLDNWDPALIDALAADRRVITFDNVGVGGSTGRTPAPWPRWPATRSPSSTRWTSSRSTCSGSPIGSFVAQEIALTRPDLVRRLVLASVGAAGRRRHARLGARGHRRRRQTADRARRIPERLLHPDRREPAGGPASPAADVRPGPTDRDAPTTWQTRQAQYDAVCTWGIPDHARLERVAASTSRCSSPTATATR